MKIRRLDEALARRLHTATQRKAAADQTRQAVERAARLLLMNPDVSDVSRAELRRIVDYAATTFGDASYFPWLYFYRLFRGEFREGWVPPDFFHGVAIDAVNGRYRRICAARTLYSRLLGSDRVPDLLYCVKGVWSAPDGTPVPASEVKARLFAGEEAVCVKLEGTAKGHGVAIETRDSFSTVAWQGRGNLTVQRYVRQSAFLAAVFPHATGTIRIATAKPDSAPALAVGAFLRVGSGVERTVNERSLDVPVLDGVGRLGAFATMSGTWRRHRAHPDTGFVFEGSVVEGFPAAARLCETLHERLPQLGFIGWDVTISDRGEVQVLEMNAGQPDVKFVEMSVGPCLTALKVEQYARRR